MQKRQGGLAKVLSLLVMGTLMLMVFSSAALAQQAQWMKDAHKMMEDGWKQLFDGKDLTGWKHVGPGEPRVERRREDRRRGAGVDRGGDAREEHVARDRLLEEVDGAALDRADGDRDVRERGEEHERGNEEHGTHRTRLPDGRCRW